MTETKAISIDAAFELLKEGKANKSRGDHWTAAYLFSQARSMLMTLADENAVTLQGINSKDEAKRKELEQIAVLYAQKATEYWHESRHCLLEAMQVEATQDKDDTTKKCSCDHLSEEAARTRSQTFDSLFSKPGTSVSNDNGQEGQATLSNKAWDIEERLQELNSSLPSGFKTETERLDSINRGLNRLGLSLYTQKEPFARFQEELPKDEDEQMADIMAQAKDEVAFEKKFGPPPKQTKATDDSDEDDITVSSEEDTESDLLLDDEALAVKHIRNKIVKAQVNLAEVLALLDQAEKEKREEEEVEGINDADGEDDASLDKPTSKSYFASGRKKLKVAKKQLSKAMNEWTESQL